tara:strand:- start:34 stop:651 length:618 start_codon:yes stop_codon:yes gene_type:complete
LNHFGLVIIGAHTGVYLIDEIELFKNEKILLIEPVPHNLKELRLNISKYKNVIIEPITIGKKKEIREFYFIKEESIRILKKHWASGIGSFSKEHILNHKTKRFKVDETHIDKINIQCLSINQLIEKYSISSITKLQIDAEGAEYEILSELDLNKVIINKILFEFKHFDGTFKEGNKLKEILKKLENYQYKLIKIDNENMLAEKKL